MVTYADIIKAINVKLESEYADIEIQSIDNKEGLIRPSFRVDLDNIKSSNFKDVAKDREMTAQIYYFPSDRNKNRIELLNMQDSLENLFLDESTIITESGFAIEIFSTEFNEVDGILHFYFDIMLSEDFEKTDDGDNMENLEFRE